MASTRKPIVCQVLTRLLTNRNATCLENGSILDNGCGKMNGITPRLLRHIRDLGATHVWYTGVIRHASRTDYSAEGIPCQHPAVVKGKAGSPYAITDYYDIDPDLAVDVSRRMEEWEALVDRTHEAGMKVIMDFVPNHVARQYHSVRRPEGVRDLGQDDDTSKHFSPENNFYYCWGQPFRPSFDKGDYEETPAKATGNDRFDASPGVNDWYETVKLNYGVDYCDAAGKSCHFDPIPDTWRKMTDILLFWTSKGVDGFRCDMAEMVPSEFWAWAIPQVKAVKEGLVFIGEVYDPGQYRRYIGAGFDWLYDKVGMYDCLRDVVCGRRRASGISYKWQEIDDIRDHMLYFLENHDEQRIASDFFAGDGFKAVPALLVSVFLQKNPFMFYAGQEVGERGMDKEGFSGRDGRTTIFDYWSAGGIRRAYCQRKEMTEDERRLEGIYRYVLNLANAEKAIYAGDFFDLMYMNEAIGDRQYVFFRKCEEDLLLIAVNFSADDAVFDVRIPQHAMDYLHIPAGEYAATDLLSDERTVISLAGDAAVNMEIGALQGRVYKMKVNS